VRASTPRRRTKGFLRTFTANTRTFASPAGAYSPDPAKYLKGVAASAVNYVHPCHVRTCNKSTLIGKNFEWDKASLSLKQVGAANSCGEVHDCNALSFDLCSDDGSLPIQHFATSLPPPVPSSCKI
jgi:hypothetical protein